MTVEEKKKIIEAHPLFKGLNENAFFSLAEQVKEKNFPAKIIMLHQDDEATNIYFIYQGLVKIYITNSEGDQVPIGTPGDRYVVGEFSMLDDQPVASYVETIKETHTLFVTKKEFLHILDTYPRISINLLRIMSQKIRRANDQRVNNFSLQLKDRVLKVLQTLATHFPNQEIALSQEELALIIGATRPRVTEILKKLEEEKSISLSQRKIRLL
jgi:CRP/FNR family transcriptional regulator, cyclic AMP receptor protein